MATRAETILSNVRIPLNDRLKERWSDSDLLIFLNKARKDISKDCQILKDWLILPLNMGQAIYTLDEQTVEVIECRFNGNKMTQLSTAEMDKQIITGQIVLRNRPIQGNRWTTLTTDKEPTVVVYDKNRRRQIRVWPTVVSEELELTETEQDTLLGIVTEVDDFTIIGDFGTDGAILNTDEGIPSYPDGVFGTIVEIVDQTAILVHRSKMTIDMETLNDDIQLDIICDQACEYYIIAMAFSNDQLEENRKTAAENLSWYNRELLRIKDNVSINNNVNEDRHTSYNGMG